MTLCFFPICLSYNISNFHLLIDIYYIPYTYICSSCLEHKIDTGNQWSYVLYGAKWERKKKKRIGLKKINYEWLFSLKMNTICRNIYNTKAEIYSFSSDFWKKLKLKPWVDNFQSRVFLFQMTSISSRYVKILGEIDVPPPIITFTLNSVI